MGLILLATRLRIVQFSSEIALSLQSILVPSITIYEENDRSEKRRQRIVRVGRSGGTHIRFVITGRLNNACRIYRSRVEIKTTSGSRAGFSTRESYRDTSLLRYRSQGRARGRRGRGRKALFEWRCLFGTRFIGATLSAKGPKG